jgi:hypothetical protein
MERTMTRRLDFFLDVARGAVSGLAAVRVWGQNSDVDIASAPEDLWEVGGLYTYTAAGGATYYISSSNGADTMDVTVTLLSEDGSGNWNEESFTVTVPGQAKTAITTPSGDDPVRIQSIVNGSGTALTGDLYVYEDDTVVAGVPQTAAKIRAKVEAAQDRTYMALYTVPSGKEAFFYRRGVGIANATGTTLEARFQKRLAGGSFRLDGRIVLDNSVVSQYNEPFPLPEPIPAKTDLKITAQTVGADNTAVSGFLELLVLG